MKQINITDAQTALLKRDLSFWLDDEAKDRGQKPQNGDLPA